MLPDQILAEADRCVKCGLCLPNCPTYRLTLDEGDSPRGRIALIQALASGALESQRLHRHLDRCLGCRACERSCPSGVHYGRLLDGVRQIQRQRGLGINRHLLELIATLPYRRVSSMLLQIYQRSGLRRLTRQIGGARLRRLDRLLPATPAGQGWLPLYAAEGRRRLRVGLFTGCVGRMVEHSALEASIRLLTRLGVEVVVPLNQGCCGALHLHNGMESRARELANRNRTAFNEQGLDAVIYLASGCGAQLRDYAELGGELEPPVTDISRFLCDRSLIEGLRLRPLPHRVQLHTPCSQRNIIGQPDAALTLLRQIPEALLQPLLDTGCCGAAGSYLLSQPQLADTLRQRTLDVITATDPLLLVTSNVGCALHLAAGLAETGSPVRVMHPVELFEQQVEAEPRKRTKT